MPSTVSAARRWHPPSQHQRKERPAVRIPGRRSSGREVIRRPTEEIVGTPAATMTREEIEAMSMTSTDAATGSRDIKNHETTSFADLGKEMWAYLTGKGAAINYEFVDMIVEVPRETGPDAPRAVWRLNGTLRITTAENASRG